MSGARTKPRTESADLVNLTIKVKRSLRKAVRKSATDSDVTMEEWVTRLIERALGRKGASAADSTAEQYAV